MITYTAPRSTASAAAAVPTITRPPSSAPGSLPATIVASAPTPALATTTRTPWCHGHEPQRRADLPAGRPEPGVLPPVRRPRRAGQSSAPSRGMSPMVPTGLERGAADASLEGQRAGFPAGRRLPGDTGERGVRR